jgi:ankyrin repeat protein
MRGDVEAVKRLLAEDSLCIHERGAHDFALLWYPVIGKCDAFMAELLLKAGAEVEAQHQLGTTALHWAAMSGRLDLIELFLQHGADINRRGRKFGGEPETPLDLARGRDQADAAALLLERGAA